jgi:hypothetical protein
MQELITMLAAGTFALGLAACERHEGPGERAGKEIDRAMDKAGQQIERAGDKIQDAARGK